MKPGDEVREGKETEQMRRGIKDYLLGAAFALSASQLIYRMLKNLVFVMLILLLSAQTARLFPRLLTRVEAPSQQNGWGHPYPHSLRLQGLTVCYCSFPLSSPPFEPMQGKMKGGVERRIHTGQGRLGGSSGAAVLPGPYRQR